MRAASCRSRLHRRRDRKRCPAVLFAPPLRRVEHPARCKSGIERGPLSDLVEHPPRRKGGAGCPLGMGTLADAESRFSAGDLTTGRERAEKAHGSEPGLPRPIALFLLRRLLVSSILLRSDLRDR